MAPERRRRIRLGKQVLEISRQEIKVGLIIMVPFFSIWLHGYKSETGRGRFFCFLPDALVPSFKYCVE